MRNSACNHVRFSADTEPPRQLIESIGRFGWRIVQVRSVENERKLRVAMDAGGMKGGSERLQVAGVADEELVFVELHFHRLMATDHGHSRTPVVEQQVFEFAEIAFEHGPIDVLAAEVVVRIGRVARLEDDVDLVTEGPQQTQKGFEQPFARNRRA